jgi:SNF2 family DNA or RNA helicase
MGLRDFEGQGCILADDMGLGKTLQGITLLWTLLKQGIDGTPAVKRALIVCPTSLVSNWDDECNKWLNGRVKTLPICDSTRAEVVSSVKQFLAPLSITLRKHGTEHNALFVSVSPCFRRCASSHMIKSTAPSKLKRSEWILNVS